MLMMTDAVNAVMMAIVCDNKDVDCLGVVRNDMFLLNDALNTFYLLLYGVGHIVNNHSDSEIRNPLHPHRLLFSISRNGYFICTIPQTG